MLSSLHCFLVPIPSVLLDWGSFLLNHSLHITAVSLVLLVFCSVIQVVVAVAQPQK